MYQSPRKIIADEVSQLVAEVISSLSDAVDFRYSERVLRDVAQSLREFGDDLTSLANKMYQLDK